jgi:hypothetical protein
MSKRQSIWIVGMLALVVSGAWAQDPSAPPAAEPASSSAQEPQSNPPSPIPAYGQENTPPPISENPPLSGLDLPSLEPHAAPLSYIQPGATFSESADSNINNTLGTSSFNSISRGLGSVTLKRLWSNYDLGLDYIGGVAYYDVSGQGFKALQQADVDQKVTWKRGQLSLRDSFSYLPEGNFGGAYGSTGSQGIESLGNTVFSSFWGGNALGTVGIAERLLNVSLVDISENLTPKSSITAAAGYGFMHFYANDPATGLPYLNSSQISAQAAYDRTLNAHTQVALVYGYQAFDFSFAGTAFHTHVLQAMYGHRISGRMDLLIGAGPQLTLIDSHGDVCSLPGLQIQFCILEGGTLTPTTTKDTRLGVAGQARLRYKFPRTSLALSYERFETSGSGFFAGAQSDIARLSAERPLTRVWSAFADIGFSRSARLQDIVSGLPARTYTEGFLGGGVHRAIGHDFHAFGSYQFNELSFDQSLCQAGTACSRISNRHVITLGLDWTPRPIRID